MSFATEVKKELLSSISSLDSCCKKAMLYGLLQGNSEIVITSTGLKVVVKSTILNVLKVMIPLIKDLYNVNIGMSYKDEVSLRKRRFYYLEIIDNADAIISDFKLMPFTHLSRSDEIISNSCCKSAFLGGLFIAKGSINDPRKNCYHFEIASSKDNLIRFAARLFKAKGIIVSTMERRNQYVMYVKRSEDISSCLAVIGASSGVFYFEDQRIVRDVNNMANRMTNCDIANEIRCAKSCNEQLDAIEYIRLKGKFEQMPARLQTIALLREEYPDSSLEELSFYSDNLFGKKLSKSGISHCMRALMNYYKDLIGNEKNDGK
jgi:DNA-binding protein WhiA